MIEAIRSVANTSVDSGSAAKRSRPEEGIEGGGTVAGASTFTSAETEQSNLSQAHEASNQRVASEEMNGKDNSVSARAASKQPMFQSLQQQPSSSATVLSPDSASGKQPANEIVELLSDEEDSRVPASEDTTGYSWYEREAERLVRMDICDKQRALSVLAEVNGDLQRAATLILDALTARAGV